MKHLQQYSVKAFAQLSESNKHGSSVLIIEYSQGIRTFDLRFDQRSFLNLTAENLTKRTIATGFYVNSCFWKCRIMRTIIL